MAVDNSVPRLTQLSVLLEEVYADDEIMAFSDPFYAVQYSQENSIDIVFVQQDVRPISHVNVCKLVQKFNENAKVYLIEDDLNWENQVRTIQV